MQNIRVDILTLAAWLIGGCVYAQQWPAIGGSNQRSNYTNASMPEGIDDLAWSINDAAFTTFGTPVYCFGDSFVTSRWNITTGKSSVELRGLDDGQLLWTATGADEDAKWHAVGFNQDAVYVHDYNAMLFYALDPQTGDEKWSVPSYSFGMLDSPLFSCNGDVIINGSLPEFGAGTLMKRLSYIDGSLVWALTGSAPILPTRFKAAYGDRIYLVTGTATSAKRLAAYSIESGTLLVDSEPLAGAAGQNHAPLVGDDGAIYLYRDNGLFYRFTDLGGGFIIDWTYTPVSDWQPLMAPAIDRNGDLLIVDGNQLMRLSHVNGAVIGTADLMLANGSCLLANADGHIMINDRQGSTFVLSENLQTLIWSTPVAGNTYNAPHLGLDGTLVLGGQGTVLSGYRPDGLRQPIAAFSTSLRTIEEGQSVQFFDQSGFSPTEWWWEFEGGTPSVSSDQNPTVVYIEPGTYGVTLRVSNELGEDEAVSDCYVEVTATVGLPSMANRLPDFEVFPNPAGEAAYLKLPLASSGTPFTVYDFAGRVVLTNRTTDALTRIDLSTLPDGVYLVSLENRGMRRLVVTKN